MVLLTASCLTVVPGTRLMSVAMPWGGDSRIPAGIRLVGAASSGQSSGSEWPLQPGAPIDRFEIWPTDTAGVAESIWTLLGFFGLCAARSLAASGTEMT